MYMAMIMVPIVTVDDLAHIGHTPVPNFDVVLKFDLPRSLELSEYA